jgi:subtilisin family serine protease
MKKRIVSSFIGLSLLADLAQAHQFYTTDISEANDSSFKTMMIKASAPLTALEKEKIYRAGIESIVYAGELQYYIYGDTRDIEQHLKEIVKIEGISAVLPSSKVSKVDEEDSGVLGSLGIDGPLNLNILLIKEMSKEAIEAYFQKAGIEARVYNVTPSLKSAKIKISAKDYEKIKALPLIHYIDKSHTLGVREVKSSRNLQSASYENIPTLWSSAYHLNGEGMSVAVVDGGLVRNTHQEFVSGGVSSVILEDTISSFADHATHVAGTLIADGDNEKARGVANQATLYSYTFLDSAFADVTVKIYQHDGVLFSNHSYGYSDMTKLGEYDSEAAKQDRAVESNPFLNIFEAAGNDGENPNYPAYGKIKGPGNSKNILTIGALNINASGVARFSSNGPTRDGRIKPELCARGESVYSTGASSDDAYFWMGGTSMATPSATGIGLLVAQAYKRVSGGYDIRHDILKACMINSAIDKGRKGPDFDSGFGLIDAEATVETINSLSTTKPRIYADSVAHKDQKVLPFEMEKAGHFKATISWIDPEASPSSNKALVNDIDMWLESEEGKRYYPYTLDATNPTALAVKNRANHVDNNEQIEVENLPAGSYKLVINGSLIVSDRQEFAIASNVSISSESHLDTLQPSQLHNFAKVIQEAIY